MVNEDLIKGSFYVSLSNIVFSIGNFVFWLIIGRLLNLLSLGYITTVVSVAMVISTIANIGFNYVILREFKLKKEVLLITIFLSFFNTLVLSPAVFLLKSFYPDIVYAGITIVLAILGINCVLFSQALITLSKYKELLKNRIILTILKVFLASLLFVYHEVGILVAMILSSFISLLHLVYCIRNHLKWKFNKKEIINSLKIGISNYPSIISNFFIASLSVSLLAYFIRKPELISIYYFSIMFLLTLEIIPNTFNQVSIPTSIGNKDLTKDGLRLGLGFSLPLIFAGFILSKHLLAFIKPEFIKSFEILKVLIFALVSDIIIQNSISYLNVHRKLKELAILGSFRLFLVITLFLMFPNYYPIVYVLSSIIPSILYSITSNTFNLLLKFYIVFVISYIFMLLSPMLFVVSIPLLFMSKIIRKDDFYQILKIFKIKI